MMSKLTDDQLRILERKFWVETGVVEQGQRETMFDYIGFARAVLAASQENNSNVENADKQHIRERLRELGEKSAKRISPYLKELERQQSAMLFALSTLEGWANYGEWVWPESALMSAKKNTIEAIDELRNALDFQSEVQPEKMPTLHQISDWWYAQEESVLGFKWVGHIEVSRVDHEDAIKIALAALHDWGSHHRHPQAYPT